MVMVMVMMIIEVCTRYPASNQTYATSYSKSITGQIGRVINLVSRGRPYSGLDWDDLGSVFRPMGLGIRLASLGLHMRKGRPGPIGKGGVCRGGTWAGLVGLQANLGSIQPEI